MTPAPARECAFAVVRRVFEQGAYADRAFAGEASKLDSRDRSLAMRLAYGTIQRRATLDHVAECLTERRVSEIDAPALAALRLGLYQLLWLDGVADHAAVNDSVELAKRANRGAARLVNAVLRRAAREGRSLLMAIDDDTPAGAALLHSVPRWLAERWWQELGPVATRSLLEAVNVPAESALRVNSLVVSRADALTQLPVPARPAPGLPEGLVLEEGFDVYGCDLWRSGAVMPQSRASMLVARILAPESGDRVLDLCAAPGAKTTHLAALMGDEGTVLAVERHPGRAEALRRTCSRMRAGSVTVEVSDAEGRREDGAFDRVLVDPPCSGLGTLQSRPDIRWRMTPERVDALAELQRRIVSAGARATRPGGRLVYSVCTVSRAEGERVIEALLSDFPEFTVEDQRQLLPDRDGTDGFFLARLRRADG